MFRNANLRKLFIRIMTNQTFSGMTAAAILARFPQFKVWEEGVPFEQAKIIFGKVANIIFSELNMLLPPSKVPKNYISENQKDSYIVSKPLNTTESFGGEYSIDDKTGIGEVDANIKTDLSDNGITMPFESLVEATNNLIDGLLASKDLYRQPV